MGLLPPSHRGPSLFPWGRQRWCRWTACASAFWECFDLWFLFFPASRAYLTRGKPPQVLAIPEAFLLRVQLQTATPWTDLERKLKAGLPSTLCLILGGQEGGSVFSGQNVMSFGAKNGPGSKRHWLQASLRLCPSLCVSSLAPSVTESVPFTVCVRVHSISPSVKGCRIHLLLSSVKLKVRGDR